MPKRHIMRFMLLKVNPAHCVLLFFVGFFFSVFTVMCAGLPYRACQLGVHSAVPGPSPALLRHLCSALCFMDYCQHFFKMTSIKCFFVCLFIIFFPRVDEDQLTLLNFPSLNKRLNLCKNIYFLFLIQDIFLEKQISSQILVGNTQW